MGESPGGRRAKPKERESLSDMYECIHKEGDRERTGVVRRVRIHAISHPPES